MPLRTFLVLAAVLAVLPLAASYCNLKTYHVRRSSAALLPVSFSFLILSSLALSPACCSATPPLARARDRATALIGCHSLRGTRCGPVHSNH